MDNNSSSNDDEEPKVCTVFASAASTGSKTVFDTIAFAMPKKEQLPSTSTNIFGGGDHTRPPAADVAFSTESTSTSGLFGGTPQGPDGSSHPLEEQLDYLSGIPASVDTISTLSEGVWNEGLPSSEVSVPPTLDSSEAVDIFAEIAEETQIQHDNSITEGMNNLILQEGSPQVQVDVGQEGNYDHLFGQAEGPHQTQEQEQQILEDIVEAESPIPTANRLFANTPEVPFPVGQSQPDNSDPSAFFNQLTSSGTPPTQIVPQPATATFLPGPFSPQTETPPPLPPAVASPFSPLPKRLPPPVTVTGSVALSTYNAPNFTPLDAIYEAWIPKEETKRILFSITSAVRAGTYFPDKSHLTTPGIIYEDDLIDKVGVNMARIFGEAEASKRRILTADNVTQDDNGLRELIKLGCYRSAINLTKRLLTLYGQGPGKVGQFSKHNPHTLQLWFTRISLLIRIREFTIAESEIDAFKQFDNPDLYFEYYADTFGKERKGTMVPFHFRVLAAEILQYSKKHNETIDRLTRILHTVQQVLRNLEKGFTEDGIAGYAEELKSQSLAVWRKREIRVFYSLANASLFAKDYYNAFKYLTILCETDKEKEPQLKSAIGRFFVQLGDLSTANTYFQAAADLRSGDSDSEQADNLVDSAMITIAHGSYPEAFALLKQALPIQPDNFMITNNLGVCLLYMGKVKEALSLMESTVKNNTPELLQENVLLNLSTIYELENTDGHKKNALLRQISEYKGDGINLASLKMPNLI